MSASSSSGIGVLRSSLVTILPLTFLLSGDSGSNRSVLVVVSRCCGYKRLLVGGISSACVVAVSSPPSALGSWLVLVVAVVLVPVARVQCSGVLVQQCLCNCVPLTLVTHRGEKHEFFHVAQTSRLDQKIRPKLL
jgi:hypothetical protein